MARLKLLVQLAPVMIAAKVFLNADSAQAAALGYSLDLGNTSNSITDFSKSIVDDFGITATLTGRVATARGNVLLTAGGTFSGVVVNLTNLQLTAPLGSSLSFSGNPPLVSIKNQFTFNFGPSVLTQQVLNGSFSTLTGSVAANSVNFAAATSGLTSATTISSGPLGNTTTGNFRNTAFSIVPNTSGVLNNPTISLQLPNLFLAAGQTLFLPASACYVVTNSPSGQTLLDQISGPTAGQDAEASCTKASIPQPPQSESVPEPSAIAPLALLGMFGTAALLKRKQQLH